MRGKHVYEFMFPLGRVHAGVPLGNGGFGALVWGDGDLNITVSRNDFWDRRNGQQLLAGEISYKKLVTAHGRGDDAEVKRLYAATTKVKDEERHIHSSLLPVGRFELAFKDGEKPWKAVLDIRGGKLEILFKSRGRLSLFLSQTEDVLLLEDPDQLVERVAARPAWDFMEAQLKLRLFEPPRRLDDGWTQACPEGDTLAALCQDCCGGRRLFSLALGGGGEEARRAALANLAAVAEDWEGCVKRNREWWRDYWRDVPEIKIPSAFFDKFVPFALYKFAAATNPGAAKPCPLQGPWIEEHKMPTWSAAYTFNVNVEQIYTLALHAGKFKHMARLFDMLATEPFKEALRGNAKTMFGVEDGYLLTHHVNDLGRQCQNGFSTHSALDHAVTAWVAHLHWQYYRYTGDLAFLRDRAYPFMWATMRVYEEMLEEHDGRLSIPMAPSPEYGVCFNSGGRFSQEGRDPSMQLACAHMLAAALTEAAAALSLPPRPIWADIQRRLPRYTLVKDERGPRIALWEGLDLDISHRHHSHLGCVYPFDTLGELSAESRAVVDNSIDHWLEKGMGLWSEWCMPWAALIQTRLGFSEAPMVLLDIWKELFVNETLASVYIPKFRGVSAHRKELIMTDRADTEIMQLDGSMACVTALYEMLVHERAGVVRLFQGAPAKWRDASFRGIRVPGGFSVSAARREGKLDSLQVRSAFGGRLRIEVEGRLLELDFSPGEERRILPA